uniref:BPTI/Kunitz inhibitor domain-containing protein n=1 Tax=Sciurus vulgaris TaxID=55149 RepID=A0A8D2AI89_SCIVU
TYRPAFCLEPPYTGRCRAMMPRFFFNATSGRCETFVYGGCRGKENRFLKKEECMRICGGEDHNPGEAGGGWRGPTCPTPAR